MSKPSKQHQTPGDGARPGGAPAGDAARLLAALRAGLPDPTFLIAADGTYLDCVVQPTHPLIARPDEFLGRTVREVLPPDHAEKCMGALERALETARTQTYSYTWGPRHWDVRVTPCGQGMVLCVVQDVSAARYAEEAVWDSEQRLKQVLEGVVDPIWDWDVETDRTEISPAWLELLGISGLSGEDASWEGRVHPDDKAAVWERIEQCASGSSSRYEAEYRVRRRDGSYLWVLSRGHVVERGPDGRARRMVGTITDISGQRRAREELQESRERYRLIVETAMEGIWLVDASWRTTFANAAMARTLGTTPQAMIGRHVHEFMDAAGRAEAEAFMARRERGEQDRHALRLLRGDGSEVWTEVAATPIMDAHGRFAGALAMVTDVTERRRAEDAARASERTRQALLEAMPDAMFRIRADGTYLDYSAPAGANLLVPPERFLGRKMRDVLPAELVPPAEHALERAISEARVQAYDYEVTREGVTRQFEVRMVPCAENEVLAIVRNVTDARRSEAALRRSEQMLGLHLRQTVLGVIECGPDGRIRSWNAGAERIFGHPASAAVGAPALDLLVPPKERGVAERVWHALMGNTGGTWSVNENRTADGRRIVCEWFNTPLVDERGAVLGIASVVHDVTERVRAEEELRRSRERYETLVNSVDGVVWEMDPQTQGYTFVSAQVERVLGFSAAQLTEIPGFWESRVYGEDRAWVLQFRRAASQDATDHQLEYRVLRADGKVVWVRDCVTVVTDETGRPTAVRGIMMDITERKRAEDALRRSEARFRSVVESNMVGIYFWDERGVITDANDVFLTLAGLTREELASGDAGTGVPARDLTPTEQRALDERAAATMRRTGRCEPYAKDLLRRDGTRVPVLTGAALVEGQRERGVCFVLDITERRRSEQHQAFMMAELDHRVKNNLAAVQTLAEQTLRSGRTLEEAGEALSGRLRALARTHSALAQTQWHGTRLLPLVQQTLEAFRHEAPGSVELNGEDVVLPPRVGSALGMALHELATNAFKYGSLSVPGGSIHVSWREEAAAGGGRVLRLQWVERGGPPVTPPLRRGFGRELIEGGMAYDSLGRVKLEFAPDGVRCEMTLHLREEPRGTQGWGGMVDQAPSGG